MRRAHAFSVLFVLVLVSGCGRSPRLAGPPLAAEPPSSTPTASPGSDSAPATASVPDPPAPTPGRPTVGGDARFEDGIASWYGDPYHGRRAASGEVFDKNKLTAAHRTLPFDTWVRVENQSNGRSVDVRINDRGPFVAGRVIDLSEAAAREIDMIRAGVVPVRVSVLREPGQARAPTGEDTFYVVQLGAFEDAANARSLARSLEGKYTGVYVEPPGAGSSLHRVLIGRALLRDARFVQDELRSREGIDSIVLQVAD